MEGDVKPGSSPATVEFGGNAHFGAQATLQIEIGGVTAGSEHDQINVAGVADLGGTLAVELIDTGFGTFEPQAGDHLEIVTAMGGISGPFATEILPPLSAGLMWNLDYGANVLALEVLVEILLGDMDCDGDVDFDDIDDFVVILAAPVSSATQTVPEPGTAALLCLTISILALRRLRYS